MTLYKHSSLLAAKTGPAANSRPGRLVSWPVQYLRPGRIRPFWSTI